MTATALLALILPMVLLAVFAAVVVLRRIGAGQPRAVTRGDDGRTVVPVRQLTWHGGGLLGATTRNGISPMLVIGSDALHFKVLRAAAWPYPAITAVECGRALFGYQLRFSGDGTLFATVADAGVARAALAALPPGLPLGPAALALRGG